MTTPQYKFFDTVKKVFVDKKDNFYLINQYTEVFSLEKKIINTGGTNYDNQMLFDVIIVPHIIAVPFTGICETLDFINSGMPIYLNDVVYRHAERDDEAMNCLVVFFEGAYWLRDKNNYETILYEWPTTWIGSSLTNPELLEDK